jgi:Methyltransferase domain
MSVEPVPVKLLHFFRRMEAVRRRVGFVQAISRGIQVVCDRLRTVRRYSQYWSSVYRHPFRALDFIFFDPEIENFTYDLANPDELAVFMGSALGIGAESAGTLIQELEQDAPFREELNRILRTRPYKKHTAFYGRRAGWYCAVRALRPQVVIETGVHDGLGSSVLLRALERNRAEGADGRLIGIDLLPSSGWLVPPRFRDRFTLVVEDSTVALPRIAERITVDLLIHDSDHNPEHEFGEYLAVYRCLSAGGVLLSDNAHATDALKRFSESHGRPFYFWREKPKDHVYPGAGIGLSLSPGRRLP